LAIVLLIAQGRIGHAQALRAPTIRLAPAIAQANQEFRRIASIRELPSGVVIVLDPPNVDPIVLVDFDRDTVRPVGRRGQGPGEFQGPVSLAPVGGDSTIITDGVLLRWTILSGEAITSVAPRDKMPVSAVGVVLSGGDRRGRVLGSRGFRLDGRTTMSPANADSVALVVGHLAGNGVDTVARIRGAGARMQPIRLIGPGTESYPQYLITNPLLVADQAVLFPDGWIGVAHVAPYRVDWLDPLGKWVRGRPIPVSARSVTEEDRRTGMGRAFRGADSRSTPTSVIADWPSQVPPFLEDALLTSPTGDLVIRLTPSPGETATRYHVIDRRGTLVGLLELSDTDRLVGLGDRGAYVAAEDADGAFRLRRHPLPSLSR
jgi:hypothetical protein